MSNPSRIPFIRREDKERPRNKGNLLRDSLPLQPYLEPRVQGRSLGTRLSRMLRVVERWNADHVTSEQLHGDG